MCKADVASFYSACDVEIHSANSLASRHHRVPVLPIFGSLHGPPAADPANRFLTPDDGDEMIDEEDEDEAASWLLLNPTKNNNNQKKRFLFGGEVDEYLDFIEYNSCVDQNQFNDQYNHHQQQHHSVPQKSYESGSVVPVHSGKAKGQLDHQQQQQDIQLGFDFESSKSAFSYHGSISHIMQPQLAPLDREARVLRYKEKKKTRKLEKTIRYASRKAYAETRPRIKGWFTKRTNTEVEVDQMFSTTLMAETGYGTVPSL